MSLEPFAVVGLGNPGAQYAKTRHNIGQLVGDELADAAGVAFRVGKAGRAQVSIAEVYSGGSGGSGGPGASGGTKLILAKSLGFMNTSGGPVSGLLKFFGIPPERLIVLHDDLDLPFDTLRIKQGGGHGGHNGLRDIIAALGTGDFIRLRLGIGRPPGRTDSADFVLQPFTKVEQEVLPAYLADAATAIRLIVSSPTGLAEAQQRFHTSS